MDPTHQPPPLDPALLEAANRAIRQLRDLATAVMGRHGLPEIRATPRLEVTWHPGMSPEELVETLQETASEAASEFAALRKGHVYCYACQSAACPHSRPPSDDQVFAGYESTGRASWIEFFNLLLNLGDRRTSFLFESKPVILARVIGRQTLIDPQLVSFGRNSLAYRIWGQVVAGYLPGASARTALTIQLVETRDHHLHLQVIASEAAITALAESAEGQRTPLARIHEALAEARLKTRSLNEAWPKARHRDERHRLQSTGFGILKHLAHSIEQKGKQEQRRTRHAELRGTQDRPVHKAQDDAAAAPPDAFYRDVLKNAGIVVGKGGRLHVFSQEGKHVTTLLLGRDEVDRRIQRRRYQPLTAEEAETFRLLICPEGDGKEG